MGWATLEALLSILGRACWGHGCPSQDPSPPLSFFRSHVEILITRVEMDLGRVGDI